MTAGYSDRPGEGRPPAFHERVDRGRTRGLLVVVLVVPLVLVAFSLGHNLGSQGSLPRSTPPPTTARPTPSPSPQLADIVPGTVSEELRASYYAAAAGGTAVCVIREAVKCVPVVARELRFMQAAAGEVEVCLIGPPSCPPLPGADLVTTANPYLTLLPLRLPALPATALTEGHVVVVADLSTPLAVGVIVNADATGRIFPQRLAPVDPGDQGIDYFDAGGLNPGRYTVLINRLIPLSDVIGAPNSSWGWRPFGLALDVQPRP